MRQQNNKKTVKLKVADSYFNDIYLEHFHSTNRHRYNVFYGGSGSGKSRYVADYLILDLLQNKKTLLVVRQTFTSLRDSAFKELIDAMRRMNILTMKGTTVSQTTLRITLPNGSQILFRGCDDEGKLLSISGIDLCWIEEASEISKDIFNQLELRLRGGITKKQFYLTFNPISALHWLKAEFFDNPKNDTYICHSTYLDNRWLDQDYIDNLLQMKQRNPQKYEIYAIGKWGTTGKKVYENWKIQEFDIYDLVKVNSNLHTAIGLDYGFVNDPSTLICSLVDLENRKLYIFDELYQKGLLNNEFAQKIIEMGYARQTIVADSAEKKSIEEMRQYGIMGIKAAKKGRGSIMQGVQFIQQFEIFVHPSCKHMIDELENYSFKKDKQSGLYLNEPVDSYNHLLDALRYSLEEFNSGNNKVIFLPKALLGI